MSRARIVEYLEQLPLGLMLGFVIGAIGGIAVADFVSGRIDAEIERDAQIQQQCLDGNDNACRVMEFRRG